MANGIRMRDTGEVELELDSNEAQCLRCAAVYLLNDAPITDDFRKQLLGINHCLEQIGVKV